MAIIVRGMVRKAKIIVYATANHDGWIIERLSVQPLDEDWQIRLIPEE